VTQSAEQPGMAQRPLVGFLRVLVTIVVHSARIVGAMRSGVVEVGRVVIAVTVGIDGIAIVVRTAAKRTATSQAAVKVAGAIIAKRASTSNVIHSVRLLDALAGTTEGDLLHSKAGAIEPTLVEIAIKRLAIVERVGDRAPVIGCAVRCLGDVGSALVSPAWNRSLDHFVTQLPALKQKKMIGVVTANEYAVFWPRALIASPPDAPP